MGDKFSISLGKSSGTSTSKSKASSPEVSVRPNQGVTAVNPVGRSAPLSQKRDRPETLQDAPRQARAKHAAPAYRPQAVTNPPVLQGGPSRAVVARPTPEAWHKPVSELSESQLQEYLKLAVSRDIGRLPRSSAEQEEGCQRLKKAVIHYQSKKAGYSNAEAEKISENKDLSKYEIQINLDAPPNPKQDAGPSHKNKKRRTQ